MKPVVLITKNVYFSEFEILKEYFEVEFLENTLNLAEIIIKKNPYAIITFVTDKISEDMISNFPDSLKVISNFATGYNNIDIETCRKKGIKVTNTPDVLTDATADLTMGILLTVSRKILSGHKMIMENKFHGWEPDMLLGNEMSGKTLGIIGMGRIGLAVAKRAKAFGLKVIYYKKNPEGLEFDSQENIYYTSLEELIKSSDFISINCALNKETKHIISIKQFEQMKKNVFIVNTARGECINENALVFALKKNLISGAALDVFEFEPKVTEELKTFDNVVLTPHIGSATIESRGKMAFISSQNIIDIYLDRKPYSQVV